MAPTMVHCPDGQKFNVTPVFAGLFFKSHDLNTHPNAFPIGWTVVLHTEDDSDGHESTRVPSFSGPNLDAALEDDDEGTDNRGPMAVTKHLAPAQQQPRERRTHIHSFTRPTLQNDSLFISSISNPSSSDFKPAASPTRQIAMMIWVSLYWYFHQPAPDTLLPPTKMSGRTVAAGRPRGEWRINIKRDGVLRGRNLIPKLERMGLLSTLESSVGPGLDDSQGWGHMYVSKKMFWQIPGGLFLFTLQPTAKGGASYPGSPVGSRPGSPSPSESSTPKPLGHSTVVSVSHLMTDLPGAPPPTTLVTMPSFPIGPYFSSSHLPTYYPPGPLQYAVTNHVRHPVRPKPPRMGEVFYTRFVPSAGQYLSLRVASLSPKPVPYMGPVGPRPPEASHLATLSDTSLLQMWLGSARVQEFWGDYVPNFLSNALASRHSFPAIAMWDGVPFGYLEIYWVKEDLLGRLGAVAGDFDRGFHVMIGEEWARGRVQLWLSSLVHWMLCADYRTMCVCAEPRVDNARFIQHLQFAGFSKEKEVAFPHKQAWFGRLQRDNWGGPAL